MCLVKYVYLSYCICVETQVLTLHCIYCTLEIINDKQDYYLVFIHARY